MKNLWIKNKILFINFILIHSTPLGNFIFNSGKLLVRTF